MNKKRCACLVLGALISLLLPFIPARCFSAGLTYSFDDGHISTYSRALPVLSSYGQVGTANVVYFWIGRSGTMSFDQIKELESEGWEICSHSLTHPRFDQIPQDKSEEFLEEWIPTPQKSHTYEAAYGYQSLPFISADNRILRNVGSIDEVDASPGSAFFDPSGSKVYIHTPDDSSPENYDIRADSVEMELEQSKLLLEAQGLNIQSFVVPFSKWSEERARISEAYYNSAGAAGTFNDIPPKDPYYLRRLQIESYHTVEDIKEMVDTAIENDLWLILMFHGIGYPEEGCTSLCWTPEQLDELAAYVSGCGIEVVTQQEGLALTSELPPAPLSDLRVNGKDDAVTVSSGLPVEFALSLDPKSYSGKDADWWFYVDTQSGIRYYFDASTGRWVTNETPALQGPLYTFPLNIIRRQVIALEGAHTFYAGVDLNCNGVLDEPSYLDSVQVIVQQ